MPLVVRETEEESSLTLRGLVSIPLSFRGLVYKAHTVSEVPLLRQRNCHDYSGPTVTQEWTRSMNKYTEVE